MTFQIPKLDQESMEQARVRQNSLAKPPGSLGMLEQYSVRIAGISGQLFPNLSASAIVVFAADNGVCAEGVTMARQEATAVQSANMSFGRAGISVLCAHADAKLFVVDVGMIHPCESRHVLDRKFRRGTNNIAQGPAMDLGECKRAMQVGAEMAQMCKDQGFAMVGAGEMGVGNTTTSSAILSVLTGLSPAQVAGRGAGLTDDGYQHKIDIIGQAIMVNQPNAEDGLDVLHKLGGFDLAALAGFYLEAARLRRVCVVDGFIAIAAALVAKMLNPRVCDYLFLSHRSAEPGYDAAARQLGLEPMIDMGMRLGEGSGCPLAFMILTAAVRLLRDMSSFDELGIDQNWSRSATQK